MENTKTRRVKINVSKINHIYIHQETNDYNKLAILGEA